MSKNPAESHALPVLAIVVPCFNEEEALPDTLATLSEALRGMADHRLISPDSYLYFVDDGSVDSTWPMLRAASRDLGCVRGAKLSRNFGHQSALLAGLLSVRKQCDIAISIDADLQQDPRAMREFVQHFRAGAEVVFGVRRDRATDTGFKRITAQGFYRLMQRFGVNLIPNHADYRLLSRRALEALAEHGETNIFLRAVCAQLGFRSARVGFDVTERAAGQSKYSLAKMLKLAIDGITSFSVVPLRLIALLGLLVFGASVAMGGYVLYTALVVGGTVPGWASTILPIYFLGGVQILCLAVIGEYIAQILTGVKSRPRYIIEDEIFLKYLYGATVFVFYALVSCYGLYLLKASPSIWSTRFLTGGMFYALGAAIWVAILKFFPLSFAFPIAASVLMIGTSLTGYLFLGERIAPVQIAGVVLILAGVFLISTTTGKS